MSSSMASHLHRICEWILKSASEYRHIKTRSQSSAAVVETAIPQGPKNVGIMYESPNSLQDVCLHYICDNIEALCEATESSESGQPTMQFRAQDIFFHSHLSDSLLALLNEKQKLSEDTMTLFDSNVVQLKRVKIKDAQLTTRGLRVLKGHRLTELEVTGLREITVNDLIGCLGEWTLANLRTLNVTNCLFMNSAKFSVVVSLSKLKNLQSLNVSNTGFNKHGLEIIVEDLPALEILDISRTPIADLSPLRKCKKRLKYLSMYNLRASHREDLVAVLSELHNLRYLDVSDDCTTQPFGSFEPTKFKVENLLGQTESFLHLTTLDISGKDSVSKKALRLFIESHTQLRFLGLALTDACEFPLFTDKDTTWVTTGEATETQILESLRRYSRRLQYVQRSLYHLFRITQYLTDPRVDIIQLILPAMQNHPKALGVQMAATACLYNLTKGELGQKIHPSHLTRIINLTMDAMHNFPNHLQLQKNALLTLCSDRILQDVTFDRFRCAQLVMDCLCSFEDSSMNRMSVAICSILAAKIPTVQTSHLGTKTHYMKKLLAIVKEKMQHVLVDITMKFTLSALWNLTDESPSTCEIFLLQGGLELFLDVMREYRGLADDVRIQVETKVLGLINNLAEVKDLQKHLMRDDVLVNVRELLKSKQIDVSYFAAGIISHLVTSNGREWNIKSMTRQEVLTDLGEAVQKWEQPTGEMVAYRSFSPFFPLLEQPDAPEVQLWALWAILHVCTKNGRRYCPMLVAEGGVERLAALSSATNPHVMVQRLATSVLQLVERDSFSVSEGTKSTQ